MLNLRKPCSVQHDARPVKSYGVQQCVQYGKTYIVKHVKCVLMWHFNSGECVRSCDVQRCLEHTIYQ